MTWRKTMIQIFDYWYRKSEGWLISYGRGFWTIAGADLPLDHGGFLTIEIGEIVYWEVYYSFLIATSYFERWKIDFSLIENWFSFIRNWFGIDFHSFEIDLELIWTFFGTGEGMRFEDSLIRVLDGIATPEFIRGEVSELWISDSWSLV